jgi:hypothetical protein
MLAADGEAINPDAMLSHVAALEQWCPATTRASAAKTVQGSKRWVSEPFGSHVFEGMKALAQRGRSRTQHHILSALVAELQTTSFLRVARVIRLHLWKALPSSWLVQFYLPIN